MRRSSPASILSVAKPAGSPQPEASASCPWRVCLALLALSAVSNCLAAEIPPARRLAATIVQTIEAPAGDAMHMPTDVAVDGRGRVFIADGANNRVMVFLPDGKPADPIIAIKDQPLNRPVGVSTDASDNLWIADTGNRRVHQLDPDGRLITSVEPLKPDNEPFDPTDVAVTPDGQRTYIADNDNHCILVRDNLTRKWTTLGSPGRAQGQFQYPFMLVVGPEDYVYITESIGARVQQLSPANRWSGQIGTWGVELGQFYRPKGIAADKGGRILVSDSTLGVVQVFSARGAVQGVLCDDKGQVLRFKHPMGMAFDREGRLYVVELAANRVAVVNLAK